MCWQVKVKNVFNISMKHTIFIGESSDSVLKRSGKARYDVKITFVTGIQKGEEKPLEFTSYGAITEEGRKAYFSGVREYEIERITQKEIEEIENDFDQIEAPPGPYTIQPDKQGRTFANKKQ